MLTNAGYISETLKPWTVIPMNQNPVLAGLLKGELFPYNLLRCEREAVTEFWEAWWKTADWTSLERPKSIVDSDPILEQTSNKKVVDTLTDDFFFPKTLESALQKEKLPRGYDVDRVEYREKLVEFLLPRCPISKNPTVVFTGGGYGAGKTTALQFLTIAGKAPGNLKLECLQGVDYCKQLLPEFNQIKMVSDGRASEVCQEESRLVSDMLFGRLVEEKRTFGWDSSMSDRAATISKIEYAKKNSYQVALVGVLTQSTVAVKRAMERAFKTRRFAPPRYLHESHTKFASSLTTYLEAVDEAIIIENSLDKSDGGPQILAHKLLNKDLTIFDLKLFESYTQL